MSDQHSSNRLSGVYDLASQNPYTIGARLTPDVIEAALRRAHVERARAASALVTSAWQGLRAGARALLRGIARARQRRANHLALRHLDAHLLEDIGMGRGHGRELVAGVLSTPPARSAVRLVDTTKSKTLPHTQQQRAA